MARNTAKKHDNFLQQPIGYVASALILWIAGYILFSLAVDSGSILQWLGTIVAIVWGTVRFIKGIRRLF